VRDFPLTLKVIGIGSSRVLRFRADGWDGGTAFLVAARLPRIIWGRPAPNARALCQGRANARELPASSGVRYVSDSSGRAPAPSSFWNVVYVWRRFTLRIARAS